MINIYVTSPGTHKSPTPSKAYVPCTCCPLNLPSGPQDVEDVCSCSCPRVRAAQRPGAAPTAGPPMSSRGRPQSLASCAASCSSQSCFFRPHVRLVSLVSLGEGCCSCLSWRIAVPQDHPKCGSCPLLWGPSVPPAAPPMPAGHREVGGLWVEAPFCSGSQSSFFLIQFTTSKVNPTSGAISQLGPNLEGVVMSGQVSCPSEQL